MAISINDSPERDQRSVSFFLSFFSINHHGNYYEKWNGYGRDRCLTI